MLVQMMTAPFVHKRYRDAKDRPFESYFTTSRSTFIMVEWKLDRGAGYCLVGLMVRKSQLSEEDDDNRLEMVSFICEYAGRCAQAAIPALRADSVRAGYQGALRA